MLQKMKEEKNSVGDWVAEETDGSLVSLEAGREKKIEIVQNLYVNNKKGTYYKPSKFNGLPGLLPKK